MSTTAPRITVTESTYEDGSGLSHYAVRIPSPWSHLSAAFNAPHDGEDGADTAHAKAHGYAIGVRKTLESFNRETLPHGFILEVCDPPE